MSHSPAAPAETGSAPVPDGGSARGPRRWVSLGVLAAALSMIVLDGTIVGVALPRIIGDLRLDLAQAQWVNAVYAMVFAALLLSFGRLGDRFGRRRLLLVGVAGFVAGSVVAAMADSGAALIAARAVQGVGGAMVLPATLSTVNATFRGRDRAVAFGVWGAVMSGMAAIGPLLGGWLTTSLDWRWIFLVNVPLGVAVIAGTLLFVTETRGVVHGRGADVDGLLTSGIGFALVVFGLIEGNGLGWWRPKSSFSAFGITWPETARISIVPVALLTGVVLLGLFVIWERHRARVARSAILDLRLLRIQTFSWGNITAGTVAAGEFALVFALPLYLVNVLDLSIMGAGWVLAAMAAGAFVSGAQARHLAAALRPSGVVLVGLLLEVLGAGAAALFLGPDTAPVLIAALVTVYGVGLGLASAQLTSTVLSDVPTVASGSASAAQSTVRQVGSALGTAVAGTVLASHLSGALTERLAAIPGVGPGQAAALRDQLVASAGGSLAGLRAQGVHGRFGERTPELVHTMASGYADATQWAIGAAVAFLLLGMLGAARVAVVDRRRLPASG